MCSIVTRMNQAIRLYIETSGLTSTRADGTTVYRETQKMSCPEDEGLLSCKRCGMEECKSEAERCRVEVLRRSPNELLDDDIGES